MRTTIGTAATLAAVLTITGTIATADTYPRNPDADVLHYRFELTLSDTSDAIRGETAVEVRFLRAGVTGFELDLVGPTAGQPTGMTVTGVWDERIIDVEPAEALVGVRGGTGGPPPAELVAPPDRTPLDYHHDADRLRITFDRPTRADETRRLIVAYHGTAATGLTIGDTRHGDRSFFSDNWPNKARHWLPTLDHPYDKATSEMVVTAPVRYQVVSNGRLVEETDLEDGLRRTHWRQSVPIATWLYVLGVARFAVEHRGEFRGVPIQTWVYAEDRDAGFWDFAVPTRDVLEFYSEWIGPYAYEKLANIQSNSVGGGMEAASAIFYGDDSVTGDRSIRWRNVIIHELAHQWFGNAVTESDWNDVWLSEGFATYFTLLFREHAYGRDDFVEGLVASRDRVLTFDDQNPGYRVVHENLSDMSRVTSSQTYQKGGWTLHMLRGMIGDDAFWDGIQQYYRRFMNANATTADFRTAMEDASGQPLEWFFRQWLEQGGYPVIEVAWTWQPDTRRVEIELAQTQATPGPFRVPVELELRFADGRTTRHSIALESARSSFAFDAADEPTDLVIDPDVWLLGRWTVRRN